MANLFYGIYEVEREIGSGSGGTVYKAYHRNLKKYVVLKRLHENAAEFLNRRAEADALKNLRHSYLPQVYDFIETDQGIFTVMDFIEGETFQSLLDRGIVFSQKQTLKYATQLFEVLTYIHSQNPKVIHGDIKPENIILTPTDNICLIDFNISALGDEEGVTIEGYTQNYAAPEQIRAFANIQNAMGKTSGRMERPSGYQPTEIITSDNAGPAQTGGGQYTQWRNTVQNTEGGLVDERADIYSAAATIYRILTGQVPQVVNGVVPGAQTVRPQVSEGFDYILSKALQQDPAARFQTSQAALDALRNIRKLESKYKGLVRKQILLFALAMVLLCAGIVLLQRGRYIMREERADAYDALIAEMDEITRKGVVAVDEQSRLENLYEEALDYNADRADAYLQKAAFLYRTGQYEQGISFVEDEVFTNGELLSRDGFADLCYLYGSCLFSKTQPDYLKAAQAYERALRSDDSVDTYYRDLAIAYARSKNVQKAQEALSRAEARGVKGENLLLVQGEVALARGEYASAEALFTDCADMAEDEDIRMRAYLGWHDACLGSGKNETNLERAKDALEAAQADVPPEKQIQILQSLAQDYIDLFQATGNTTYAAAGIKTLDKALGLNRVSFDRYTIRSNQAFLHEQIGEYDAAYGILRELLEENNTDYRVYKRLAFLEADIQNEKDVSARDYHTFEGYYLEAKRLYSTDTTRQDDLEMQLLDQMYAEMQGGGWL